MRNTTKSLVRIAGLACGCSLIALTATPAQAQTVCINSPLGVLECGTADPVGTIDLPAIVQPVSVLIPNAFETASTILIDATGAVILDGDIVATTLLDNRPALDITSDADIFAQVTALSSQGDNSAGAVLRAVDGVVFIADETVTTLGDFSNGIDISAATVDVSIDELRTAGIESDGVQLVSLSGPATLDANLIETLGSGSTAAILRAAGDIGVNVGVLRTEGDQALGLDLQSDATACAVLGAGSCDVNAIVGSITTDGFGSIGALVVAAGNTDLAIDVLQTGGDEAAGLDLSADPVACVALGVGSCDTAFTVQNLTTNGARSPGAVVRAVGDIDGSVGVLTTNGEDAIGLDLASDPTACAILGAGACETSFSVGQLTTSGDGAIGALVRAAGPTTVDIGILETFGDNASGLDIAADPAACLVLGLGQCDTTLTGDRITTLGNGSAGVLINSPGQIVADLGLVQTGGNDAPAITLITDPAVCILLGAGACGVTLGGGDGGEGPDVDTGGDNSPGVVIVSPGPIDADVDDVDTDGDNSPGIDIDGGEGPITVDFGDVTTDGDNSTGVIVDGTGRIDVTGDSVTTGGANSPGVVVTGDDDPVTVNVGAVTTTGPGSNGIDVTTTTGDQTITAGPVVVSGAGSSGIVATATGCADINITAIADVSSASGIGIDAESACTVSITTLPGADVSGGLAGIEATSGTGSTIVIGGALSSTGGPALDADGGAATVVVGPTGSIIGAIDLTDNGDTLTNNGTLIANASSNFGAGADLLTNNGLIRVDGQQTYVGLETLANTGLIDMRDGATGDTLTLTGNYTGSGGAALGVDIGNPAASDRLIVGGAATGSTAVLVAANGAFVSGATVVDAGAGTAAGAFTLPATSVSLTDYTLAFDAAANDFLLYGTPSAAALGAGLIAQGAREVFYRGNEAVAGHLGSFGSGSTAENPRISRAIWGQGFGVVQDRDATIDSVAFGQASSANLDSRQDWFGLQVGADLVGGGNSVLGVTAGYIDSRLKLRSNPAAVEYGAWNAGVYGRASIGALFVKGLLKYEHYSVDYRVPTVGVTTEADGDGWGGWLEVGARLGGDRLFVEPSASIEYARVNLDGFTASGTDFDLDEENGLRGKAGVRVGAVLDTSPSLITAYAGVQAIHEFRGRDQLTLTNAGGTLTYNLPRTDTYGRATVGFDAVMASGVRGFIEGTADFAGGVSGHGARAGLSISF